jgi:hypothetical protein
MTDALQTQKVKKKTLFAGALAAGLLTLGMGMSGTAAASSYGGGHGYGHDGYSSGHDSSYDSSYYEKESYAKSVSYTLKYSCDYSDYYKVDHYGKYHKWAFNANTGTWFSCDFYENYEQNEEAERVKKADFSADNSHYYNRYH